LASRTPSSFLKAEFTVSSHVTHVMPLTGSLIVAAFIEAEVDGVCGRTASEAANEV
jgi:hypothetical protein